MTTSDKLQGERRQQLSRLPSIEVLLEKLQEEINEAGITHALLVRVCRQTVQEVREQLLKGAAAVGQEALLRVIREKLKQESHISLKRVINATGVILHTNLGRAPLSARAQQAVDHMMAGYNNVEYNLVMGTRGSRVDHVRDLLCELTGAEDSLVVNNNAAAVLLVLSTLAQGKTVLVSRGQLVEIGGSFRIPEVLAQSGATLVEVGTTNKTKLRDYEQAITESTALILKVHTSNYRIVGFTEQPTDKELVELGRRYHVPVIHDLGSGTLLPLSIDEYREPEITENVKWGYDVVTFSGDKLLGGPQAGLIVGKKSFINQMQQNPLLRALRIDKLSLAALQGTLLDYVIGQPTSEIPVQFMLRQTLDCLEKKAVVLCSMLQDLNNLGWSAELVPSHAGSGGGALPAINIPGVGVAITSPLNARELDRRLRSQTPPVVARIQDQKIVFHMHTVSEDELRLIAEACRKIAASSSL